MLNLHKDNLNLDKVSQLIFDNATLMIYTWDLEGKITSFNPYGQEVTGYKAEEVIGKSWMDIFLEDKERGKVSGLIDYVKTGRTLKHIIGNLWKTKQDDIIEFIWTTAPIFDQEGNVVEFISFGTDITQHKTLVKKLNNLAYYDDLTKLPNRELAEEEINKIIERSKKVNKKMALLSIDIDNFKEANNTIGNEVANRLLMFVSEILKKNTDTYYLCKFDEDEFGIVFYDVKNKDHIEGKVERLLEEIRKPWITDGYNFQVSVNIGISLYPQDGEDFSDLKNHSNMAMYRAKKTEKNGCLFYDESMKTEIENNIFIINNIGRSMSMEHFSLHYQPVMDLRDGSIFGFEALIRWHHPERGYIPPMDFIPIIEESGQIIEVTSMVLNMALRQKQIWNEKGYRNLKMSVNISGRSLLKEDIYEEINKLLIEYNISPREIILEITETALLSKRIIQSKVLKRLIDRGLEIALDDFGTGYSSLARINNLPLKHLKIDKCFIDNIEEDTSEEALVKYIIDLGCALDLNVVAEGVETKGQMELLKKLGCHLAQGYYYAKPMPAHDLDQKFLLPKEGI